MNTFHLYLYFNSIEYLIYNNAKILCNSIAADVPFAYREVFLLFIYMCVPVKGIDPLDLELQAVVGHFMWVPITRVHCKSGGLSWGGNGSSSVF